MAKRVGRRKKWGQRSKEMKNIIAGTLPPQVAGERFIGRVKWFSQRRGYGFIDWQGDKDVFVHRSAVLSQGHKILQEGQRVEFEIRHTPKGPEAVDVIGLPKGVEQAMDHPKYDPRASKGQKHRVKRGQRSSDPGRRKMGLFVYSYTIQRR